MTTSNDPRATGSAAHFDLGSGRPTGEIRKLTSLLEVEPGARQRHQLQGVAAPGARDPREVARRAAQRRGARVGGPRRSRSWRRWAAAAIAAWQSGVPGGALARQVFTTGRPVVVPRVSREPALGERRPGEGEALVCLRPAAVEPPRDRRAVCRAALQGGARLRAHRQVLRRHRLDDRAGDQGPAAARGRARGTGAGKRAAAGGAARALRLLPHPRHQPRDARGLRADDAGHAHQHHGAHPRRVGHRQGADRAGDPLQLAARRQAVRQGELRGAARHADRVGAVRLREGGLHRRGGAKAGPLRAGRRRHALPRRDRRRQPRDPGQAAARAAGARVRAGRRRRAGQGQRAAHRRDQHATSRTRLPPARSARTCSTA